MTLELFIKQDDDNWIRMETTGTKQEVINACQKTLKILEADTITHPVSEGDGEGLPGGFCPSPAGDGEADRGLAMRSVRKDKSKVGDDSQEAQ